MGLLKNFNYEHAFAAMLLMFILITIANIFSGTVEEAVMAGAFQSLISFVIIGINTGLFEFLSKKYHYVPSILIPVTLTTTISYSFHAYRGTPEPFFSALVVFVLALINYCSLTYLLKKQDTISLFDLYKNLIFRICINKQKKDPNHKCELKK
jgi:hypothetical protein